MPKIAKELGITTKRLQGEHDFTSIVVHMAINQQDTQEEYERYLREAEEMCRARQSI